MDVIRAFGTTLKKYRIERNLSQEELALNCNLDRTYIGLLERFQRQPTISTIFILCEQLNVPPHEFIEEIEKIMVESSE